MNSPSKQTETSNYLTLAIIGDSLANGHGAHNVLPDQYAVDIIASRLRMEQNVPIKSVNWGVAGDISPSCATRLIQQLRMGNVPDILLIQNAVNDPANQTATLTAAVSAGATTLPLSVPYPWKYVADWCAGVSLQIGSETNSAVTYSPLTQQLVLQNPLVGSYASGATVTFPGLSALQTQKTIQSMAQQALMAGTQFAFVPTVYMQNFAGKDSQTGQDPGLAALRLAQAQAVRAVADPRCQLVDTFTDLQNSIGSTVYYRGGAIGYSSVTGRRVAYFDANSNEVHPGDSVAIGNQDSSFHIGVGNLHLNPLGQQIVADGVYSFIVALGILKSLH